MSRFHVRCPKFGSSSRPRTLPTKSSAASASRPTWEAAHPAKLGRICPRRGEAARLDSASGEWLGREFFEDGTSGEGVDKAGIANARPKACKTEGRAVPCTGYAPCRRELPPRSEPRMGIGDIGVDTGA